MSTEKTVKVSSTADLSLALAAGYTPDQIVIDNTAAVAEAHAKGLAEGKAASQPDTSAIRAEAANAERVRITAINKLARKGFDAELKTAIESGHSPEAFALAVMTAAADRGITLEAINNDSPAAANRARAADHAPDAGKSWDAINAETAPKRM